MPRRSGGKRRRHAISAWPRTLGAAALLTIGFGPARTGEAAEQPPVPLSLQVGLLTKVAPYDRKLVARAGKEVRVEVVRKRGDASSEAIAEEFAAQLERVQWVANLPLVVERVPFPGVQELARGVRARHTSIVYFSTGFAPEEIRAIAEALSGADVLTVAAIPTYVEDGLVLGFDLVSAKPKLLLRLNQARKQNVDFSAELLQLTRVLE